MVLHGDKSNMHLLKKVLKLKKKKRKRVDGQFQKFADSNDFTS